jgi:uncharacterized protein (TIGR00299 family) protein
MNDTLYLDCISGLSGDMFLAGLIDLGLDVGDLERGLAGLKMPEHVHLRPERQMRGGISGTWLRIDVHTHSCSPHAPSPSSSAGHDVGAGHGHAHGHEQHHHHAHEHASHSHHGHDAAHGRSFTEIKGLIARSRLPDTVKSRAISVFRRIGLVEASIHGTMIEEVHFHEVGAVDSIIDIVGTCLGLHLMSIRTVLASPLVEGRGTIQCAHGTFPIPAPATLALLQGIPLTQIDVPHELITPTGAALLVEFASSFAPLEQFSTSRIGYGLGTRELAGRPNVVRMLLGHRTTPAASSADSTPLRVAVLTTLLDDITGEHLAHALGELMDAGALDVCAQPVVMKKGRPGHRVEVLTRPEDRERLGALLLSSTTAAGFRWREESRTVLPRRQTTAATPWGPVRVKCLDLPGGTVRAKAEFEDCRRLAEANGLTPKTVATAAEQAAVARSA